MGTVMRSGLFFSWDSGLLQGTESGVDSRRFLVGWGCGRPAALRFGAFCADVRTSFLAILLARRLEVAVCVLGPARATDVNSSAFSPSASTSVEAAGVEPSASGRSLGWKSGDISFMMRVGGLSVLVPAEVEGRGSIFATGARGVRMLVVLPVAAIAEGGSLRFP